MKAKGRMLICIAIIVVLAGMYAIIDKATPIYNTSIDNNEYLAKKILNQEEIVQEFVSNAKEMDSITIKLKFDSVNDASKLVYTIKDIESDKVVADGKIKESELKNGKFHKIKLDKTEASQGKRYAITLSLSENSEGGEWVFFHAPTTEPDSLLKSDGQGLEGTMILRTICREFDLETFIVTLVLGVFIVAFMGWLNKMFK